MNPQYTAIIIAGSRDPLKSHIESVMRGKNIFKIRRSIRLFTPPIYT